MDISGRRLRPMKVFVTLGKRVWRLIHGRLWECGPSLFMEEPGASHEAIVQLFVVNLLNGLTFGAVLFLLALGLSLIFGVLGVLNLAHGALFMIGAYVGWTCTSRKACRFGSPLSSAHWLLEALDLHN